MRSYEGDVKANKGTRAISEISQVVISIIYVVLDDHVPFANSCVHRRDNKVIENLSI